MKKFFIRLGLCFACLFVPNLIITLSSPNKTGGFPVIALALITAELLARAIINKAEKSIFICILVASWVIFTLMILVD
jgi:hypothetical protein